MSKPCPEDKCFHWVPPGGKIYHNKKARKTATEIIADGDFTEFPFGGCGCSWGKCARLHDDGTEDFYEPGLGENGQWADPEL